MRKKAFFAALAGLLFLIATASGQTRTEIQLIREINRIRSGNKLQALNWSDTLARVARRYSKRMAETGRFSHYDTDGQTVIERVGEAGFTGWNKLGENLFFASGLPETEIPETAIRGWIGSPSHRKNILTAAWRVTGIGVYRTRDGRTYVTQIFADRGQ